MPKLSFERNVRFWVVLFAALVAGGVTVSLGFWQLRRAAQKEAYQAELEAGQTLPGAFNKDLLPKDAMRRLVHRRATLQGRWQPEKTLFLDNRSMAGRVGFYVVTPLALSGDGRWILVERGWVPRDFMERTRLPDVLTPVGEVSVPGRLAAAPSRVFEFSSAESGRIRQNLDAARVGQEWSAEVLDGALVQTSPSPEGDDPGLLRQWPQVNLGVAKHYGYAFQWFGLCALIVGLYVWFQIVLPFRKSSHQPR
jgi:surfeit locus 1 family protein